MFFNLIFLFLSNYSPILEGYCSDIFDPVAEGERELEVHRAYVAPDFLFFI